MADRQEDIARALQDAALDWVVRVGSDAFDDWPAFQAWLEADPRHAAAYHAAAADIAEMAAVMGPETVVRPGTAMSAGTVGRPETTVRSETAARSETVARPGTSVQPGAVVQPETVARSRTAGLERGAGVPRRARRWPVWAGGALAASLALVVGYETIGTKAAPYAVETAAGAMRTVRLADGSAITLGGATRVMLDRDDPRVATLERGQAMFVVRHDDRDPFAVTVGGARLVDVGTAFDVKYAQGQTRVAVSDGAVDYNPGRDGIRLEKGQGLVVRDDRATVIAVDVASVGSWRDSVLAYEGATLAEVADDLSRALGVDLRADSGVATRSFSGSIATAKLAGDPRLAAPLLGVTIRKRGDHWVMTARS